MPKIVFNGGPPVEEGQIALNAMYARSLGLPFVKKGPAHGRRLAIVGGGPSIRDQVEELRAFDGDLWGINGACRWLASHGIESTFISVDPHEIVATWVGPEIKKALLCARLHPSVFQILKHADVRVFELFLDDPHNGFKCCSSTASLGFDLATDLGYRSITFYGCEGSYGGNLNGDNSQDKSHAYPEPSEKREHRMVVKCGDGEYLTAPDFYVQCCELSQLIRKFPAHFSERSGGLLRAMVENDDHDIIKVSRALMESLTPIAA